jgi:hypothetical protein
MLQTLNLFSSCLNQVSVGLEVVHLALFFSFMQNFTVWLTRGGGLNVDCNRVQERACAKAGSTLCWEDHPGQRGGQGNCGDQGFLAVQNELDMAEIAVAVTPVPYQVQTLLKEFQTLLRPGTATPKL